MIASQPQRFSWAVVTSALGLLVLSAEPASAQARRPARTASPPATVTTPTPPAAGHSGLYVPGYGYLPYYAVNPSMNVPRSRGSGNDSRYDFIPPSGLNVGTSYTIDRVYDGTYIPGMGVNNGFATPEPVFGGTYIAGFGVNGGFARPETYVGGMYVPGFGVMGGSAGASFGGGQAVQGGTYTPGFGVTGGSAGGQAAVGAQSVHGGSYLPGFGVSGGQAPGSR